MGFGILGLGFGVQEIGFRVWCSRFSLGFRFGVLCVMLGVSSLSFGDLRPPVLGLGLWFSVLAVAWSAGQMH